MARSGKFEGFREASRQMNEMSKAMARGVGRKALTVPAEMLARDVRANVPVLTGETYESVDVTAAKQKGGVALQVVAAHIAAVQLEFGNSDQAATPFFRPAVDAGFDRRNQAFADALVIEVDTAVIKKAASDARKAAKG
ncbi:hypothetical protein K3M67_02995 [Sphingobium sp. V4]|uniref:HK97-gp10 family putative phage morphogenesis protein n=1 Tax=Sphingobium sp. V4 TaxID=3038927 RepID=UPI0025580B72|nr:HK97-gp10 family putative phage morphogenesis protein [Sphingobium sp. V4]WIW88963.1 hypothetical protein K3M67_02995 [Sphingobium sp. V4]